ncbi:unnamed protein product [Dovyalis caffra]|uniref:Uncharacterized protein n=1 Tax=Dovyalis caffra TaxID=77055 RepID=A0AAV1SBE9_9ROSI|nr:unnamed protein product [Dovyalis caffra]
MARRPDVGIGIKHRAKLRVLESQSVNYEARMRTPRSFKPSSALLLSTEHD